MPPMNSPSDISMNMPGAALTYAAITPTFGNIYFQLAPSQTGEVNLSFGEIPYFSLEAQIYMQQVQAATNSANQVSGSVTGQQNVTGAITVTNQAGQPTAQISAGSLPANGAAATTQPTS